jgi:YD repeat-containing protein
MLEFVETDSRISADQVRPDDPRLPEQWALGKGSGINAAEAWRETTGSPKTVIAVIDSGVDFTHPDLRDSLWTDGRQGGADAEYQGGLHGWDWVADSPESRDESGHGTAVAGIITAAGNNHEGGVGVMWSSSLMSLRVLDKENKGYVSDAVEAIDYAVAHGARVINCSWGLDEPSTALRQALERALLRGVTVVCSAGNNARNVELTPRYPAAYDLPFLISVAATDRHDRLAGSSNWGERHVALAAPGTELLTTKAGGGYETFSGSSASAAVVSGVAGLIRTLRPRLSAARTEQMLVGGARKVATLEGKVLSGGVIDASGALGAMSLLQQGEGLGGDDGEQPGGSDHDKGAGNSSVNGAAAAEGSGAAGHAPAGLSHASDLPDLNEVRQRRREEPRALTPKPSTMRRCPANNPRCNDDVNGSQRARPTPTPSAAPPGRGNPSTLAYTGAYLFSAVANALGGHAPLMDQPLLDFYTGGGYSVSDAPTRLLPAGSYAAAPEPAAPYQGSPGAVNVAAAANGASAVGSTSYDAYGLSASTAINGSRTYSGLYWNDQTANSLPDWLQVNFSGTKTVGEVDVFFLQDNYGTAEPTDSMTFTQYGITSFDVQYWTGSAWATVPGGSVSGNNKVWRRFNFPAVTTDKVRVVVNAASDGWSRIVEVEAYEGDPSQLQSGTGLTGEYYNDYNGGNFSSYVLTRADADVNFDWGGGSPSPSVNLDNFSVRWTGTVVPRYTESYTFYTTTDDGVRLWIDGQLVIDRWIDQAPYEATSAPLALEAGRHYAVRMEYYERGGGALAWLKWSSATQAKEIVPQSRLYGCWKASDQFVKDFFQYALARLPTAAELQDWAGRLNQAQGDYQLVSEAKALGAYLFTSTEYANRNRTDGEYVADLYWSYLQRAPDAGGLNFWTNEFAQCNGDAQCRANKRSDLRVAFQESAEFGEKVRNLCGTSAAATVNGNTGYNFTTARLDPVNRTGGSGVDPFSRNYNFQIPLISLPGRAGLDLGLSLSYNSLVWTKDAAGVTFDADQGFPSPGFRLGFPVIEHKFVNPQLQVTGQPTKYSYLLVTPSGKRVELRQTTTAGVYVSADSSYLQLTEAGGMPQTLRSPDGSQLNFILRNGAFRCNQLKDRNGNYLSVSYYDDGRIQNVTDTLGRVITFNYDAFLNLTSITQPWRRAVGANPEPTQDESHEWATFGYTNRTLQPSFLSLAVIGEQPGTTIPVVDWVSLPDGSYYKFDYNEWAQVWKVTHYAADARTPAGQPSFTHALSSTWLNLPGAGASMGGAAAVGASAQSDCPRFSQVKTWVEYGVQNASAEVTTGYQTWSPNMASCEITPPAASTMTDSVVYKDVYGTGWQRGLTTSSQVLVNGSLKKWTDVTWEQGSSSPDYPTNPRVADAVVNDNTSPGGGTHRRTSVSFNTFQLPDGSSCSLPENVTEYKENTTTPLRTTRTEYNLSAAYLDRHIIGLTGYQYVYDGTATGGVLRSKVEYVYDEVGNFNDDPAMPKYLINLPSGATQHDTQNFDATQRWRGNATRIRRYGVDPTSGAPTGSTTEQRAGYNVTGTLAFTADALGNMTTFDYADSFYQDVKRFNPALQTFAYPTLATTPDPPATITSSTQFNYDLGVMTQFTNPKGAVTKSRYDAAGRLARTSRHDGATEVGYTTMVYPAKMDVIESYSAVKAGVEAYAVQVLDGMGRVRAASRYLPPPEDPGTGAYNAAYHYSGQYFDYDALGRLARRSNPTEMTSAWQQAGSDATTGWVYTQQTYDWQGRPKTITNPDGTTTKEYVYDGCGCAGGTVTLMRDEVGRRQRSTTDILGRVVKKETLDIQPKTDALSHAGNVYSASVTKYNVLDQPTNIKEYAGADPGDDSCPTGTCQETTMSYDAYARLASRHVPSQRDASNNLYSTSYSYYNDDSTQTVTDGRQASVSYTYNKRGLVKTISYAAANPTQVYVPGTVTFDYDNAGKRTSMSDELGSVTYQYDTLSRLESETRAFTGAGTYSLTYQYNLADQVTSVTDYQGAQVGYDYDRAGQLKGVTGSGYSTLTTYASNIKRRAWGALKELRFGNQLTLSVGYNSRQMPTSYDVTGGAGRVMGWTYGYYDDGRMRSSTDLRDNRLDRSYSYDDPLGRVTLGLSGADARNETATPTNSPYRQSYTYDVWSHLQGRTWRTWQSTQYGTFAQTNYYSAAYANDRNGAWTYDNEGNTLNDGTRTYTYDAAGRESTVSENGVTERYDGDGSRVKLVDNTGTTFYVRSSVVRGQVLTEVTLQNGVWQKKRGYVYADGERLAKQEGGQVTWEHDEPGSGSSQFTSTSGAVTNRVETDPLGTSVDPAGSPISYNLNPTGYYGNGGNPGGGCAYGGVGQSCDTLSYLRNSLFGGNQYSGSITFTSWRRVETQQSILQRFVATYITGRDVPRPQYTWVQYSQTVVFPVTPMYVNPGGGGGSPGSSTGGTQPQKLDPAAEKALGECIRKLFGTSVTLNSFTPSSKGKSGSATFTYNAQGSGVPLQAQVRNDVTSYSGAGINTISNASRAANFRPVNNLTYTNGTTIARDFTMPNGTVMHFSPYTNYTASDRDRSDGYYSQLNKRLGGFVYTQIHELGNSIAQIYANDMDKYGDPNDSHDKDTGQQLSKCMADKLTKGK